MSTSCVKHLSGILEPFRRISFFLDVVVCLASLVNFTPRIAETARTAYAISAGIGSESKHETLSYLALVPNAPCFVTGAEIIEMRTICAYISYRG